LIRKTALILLMLLIFSIMVVNASVLQDETETDYENIEDKPLEVRFKDKFVGTLRAAGMLWLPIVCAISVSLIIIGQTFESMESLVKLSYRLFISAVIGFIIMLFAEHIANFLMSIAKDLDFTL